MDKLRTFLTVPSDLKEDFRRSSVQRNRLSMLVICIMIFGMELYNICRVLFMSSSGLGTLNNRIYFAFYCSLLLAAALYLVLAHVMRGAGTGRRWAVQYAAVLFFFMWHVAINAYDMIRDPNSGTTIFLTAALGISIFIQMSSGYAFTAYVLAYSLFFFMTRGIIEPGDLLNCTLSVIVGLAISLVNSHNEVIRISQHRAINEMNARLQELLQRDQLTGLLNRAAFQRCAEGALDGGEAALTVIIADIDDFKSVNDRYGHPCGDYVLKELALKLQTVFEGAQAIGRIGGDEFTVLLTGDLPAGRLLECAARLEEEMSGICWQGAPLGVTCSLGACIAGSGAENYSQLYTRADSALYEAKRSGKGQCRIIAI